MLNEFFHQLLVETKMVFSSTTYITQQPMHPSDLLNQQNLFSFLKTELHLDRNKYPSVKEFDI